MRRIQGKRAGLLAVAAGMTAWLALGSTAFASNHLIKIREVYTGSVPANPGSEYVELQMYASGQTFLADAVSLKLYDHSGNVTSTFAPTALDGNPPNGENQRRVLFASQAAQDEFGVSAGYTLAAGVHLTGGGGAVCYLPSTPGFADCVSWGNFNNTSGTPLPSATGGNVDPLGISEGLNPLAIQRKITAGCPALLEASDDTDFPGDWGDVTPAPLNNAATPPEHPCAGTTITKAPQAKTTDRTPTFKFSSTVNPATFRCKIDTGAFADCSSPFTSKRLSLGKHTFKVQATADSFTDPTPAKSAFKVIKKKHH